MTIEVFIHISKRYKYISTNGDTPTIFIAVMVIEERHIGKTRVVIEASCTLRLKSLP